MVNPAAVEQFLLPLVAVMMTLEIHWANAAPVTLCYLSIYKNPQDHYVNAFKAVRNKYEDLRLDEVEPWSNCSEVDLRGPKKHLSKLTKWEKLEAVEMEVNLAISVLQNQKPNMSKDVLEVLGFLMPFKDNLMACIQRKPSDHKESGHLQEFKEQFQKFNTSNAEQSPKCLEAAVGLNMVRLLQEDIRQISHHNYLHHHHHHHHRRRHHSN
ncbi:uncharacterized protein LOC134407828 [Elgaria multicarinata webbii]|uniref:uncharacterized protein LOC134407828 n=1 Tax=Elgaria multicarinata webbii TaxID=159646 RepID=UPI002FCD3070